MGDITIRGSVNGSIVNAGDHNQLNMHSRVDNSQQGATRSELLVLMQELRSGIGDAEIEASVKELLTDNLGKTEQEVQKDKPNQLVLESTIDSVKGTLERILDAGGKVEKLIPMAHKLGQLVAVITKGMGL